MSTNWDKYLNEAQPRKHHKNPSFSSVLLDEILRSIDGDNQTINSSTRKSINIVECKSFRDNDSMSFSTTSRSNSSDSSFSSGVSFLSEAEYSASYKSSKLYKSSKNAIAPQYYQKNYNSNSNLKPISKNSETFMIKSTSRAMKIYSNLKKVKQPISPGGRLSSFINSLFTSENSKKMKNMNDGVTRNAIFTSEKSKKMTKKNDRVKKNGLFSDGDFGRYPKYTNDATSTCSPASSVSTRSCLSKSHATNSKAKFDDDGVRRKVRFLPVNSMILDDDSSSSGYNTNAEIKGLRNVEKYDDEDGMSDCSEDLFEIDHLGFGNERFCDELPVYGTTHVIMSR